MTCGPILKPLKSAVAEERRRTVGRGCGERRSFPSVILDASRGEDGSHSWDFEESWGLVPCSFHNPMAQ